MSQDWGLGPDKVSGFEIAQEIAKLAIGGLVLATTRQYKRPANPFAEMDSALGRVVAEPAVTAGEVGSTEPCATCKAP